MMLKPAPVSTRQLSYKPAERKFIGEISSTHGFGRVWDDAVDEGLTLVSHTTGKEIVFVVQDVKRDAEGDIQFWTLVPALRVRETSGITITLFND